MTPADIRDLRALAEKATPGPWHECPMRMFVFGPGGGDMIASTDDNGELLIRGHGARLPMEANAHYIAAANPTTILALIAEIERLRAAELICLGCRPHDGLPNALDLSEVPR